MRRFEAAGVSTAYVQTGQGAPLLLLHGGEADHSMFDSLTAALGGRYTVIAYDQRDSGATTNPADSYSLADLAADAAALIRGLGYSRAHVMGTSLGGLIAQVLAARHPDCIDRLILSSTWQFDKSPMLVNPAAFRALAGYRADTAANAPRIAEYFFSAGFLQQRPELIDMFRGSSRTPAQQARRGGLLAQPVAASLAGFDRPVLLLAGADDRLIPAQETFALASGLAHATTQVIAGAPHVTAIQAPQQVADAITGFLDGPGADR